MSKSFSIEFVPRYILTFAVVSREMDIIILYRERYGTIRSVIYKIHILLDRANWGNREMLIIIIRRIILDRVQSNEIYNLVVFLPIAQDRTGNGIA